MNDMNNAREKSTYEWLAMVFLSGGNDLFQFGEDLLAETQRVGSSDRVAIVAEQDPTKPGVQTQRGQILNGAWDKKPIGVTAGDPKTILEFVQFAEKEFPSEKRLLVLWDHGNGWQTNDVFEPMTTAAEQIEKVFSTPIAPIDVLCFDSCLMAMIEIAYQLRGKVEYIVASEHTVPADTGWPYASILSNLTMRPQISPSDIVCAIVDGFGGSYNEAEQQPVTLSAIRVENAELAVQALNVLACELLAGCHDPAVRQNVMFARRYAQSFGNSDYIDIISFCDELDHQPVSDSIKEAALDVKKKVQSMVVAATRCSAPSVKGAHGVSIYFPDRPVSPLYRNLEFAKPGKCMWGTFIEDMAPALIAPRPMHSPHAVHLNESAMRETVVSIVREEHVCRCNDKKVSGRL